jgi:hypothetical protein
VFGGISLSGKELDIISFSMLSFSVENGVVKYKTKYLFSIRHLSHYNDIPSFRLFKIQCASRGEG